MRTNILSKFHGPSPKHCQVIKLFKTKGPSDLDLCPQDHLLVKTNISTKFTVSNHKHCRIVSFLILKVTLTWTFDLKVIYRSILPISLIVLGLIIANGFLLYVKKISDPPPLWVVPLFTPGGIIRTLLSEDL